MKRVNKQCLLDLSFEKISVESVQTKIINSFMHMFNVSTFYQQSIKLLASKAVVGVDLPIKALFMHTQKPYKGIIV